MGLRVIEAERGRALRQFIALPWSIYRGDPYWVPPLRRDVAQLLDPSHPFYGHAQRRLYLCLEGERPVGRVAAIVNHRHNEFHGEKTGFFGFFECEDDPPSAALLLETAEAWLKEQGMERSRGPASPSTNEECGLLVDGFASPPFLMMSYNPVYYAALLEGAGYRKARDLYAFLYEIGRRVPERLLRLEKRVLEREKGVTVRPLDMRRLEREMELVSSIYNEAWERNWGFVPMTPRELEHMGGRLKPLVEPGLVQVAEVEGEPAGFILTLPDYNRALACMKGRVTPWGAARALLAARRIRTCRLLIMGVRERYRRRGLETLLYTASYRAAIRLGYRYGEFSWILEDNQMAVRAAEKVFGALRYKSYRMYDKPLEDGAP